jgi:hypothetical protein
LIARFDAVLATDVCGNKDVVMRERHDGLFVRYEDHLADNKALLDALQAVVNGNDLAHSRKQTLQSWPDSAFRKQAIAAIAQATEAEHSEPQ